MTTTWSEVKESVHEWALTDWLNGQYDEETLDEWAHETADGCHYVIYYRHQDDLWTEGTVTPVHEAEVFIDWPNGDIQERIQACVYYAIREACEDAALQAIENNHCFGVRQTETALRIAGEYVTFPVLETYRAPRKR